MTLAGRTTLRPILCGALAGLGLLALLSRLAAPHGPAQTPPPHPLASRVVAAGAPAIVGIQAPLKRIVRTVQLYIPPAMQPTPEKPPVVMPYLLAKAEPIAVKKSQPKPKVIRKFKRAVLGPAKPAGRFARFCRGRGRDQNSWMRVKGRKRYCK